MQQHRNSTCGKHKEEIIQQIRDLIKLESGTNDYHEVVAPIMESYGWVSEQNIQIDYLGPASNNSWNVGPASNNSWNVTTPHEVCSSFLHLWSVLQLYLQTLDP